MREEGSECEQQRRAHMNEVQLQAEREEGREHEQQRRTCMNEEQTARYTRLTMQQFYGYHLLSGKNLVPCN